MPNNVLETIGNIEMMTVTATRAVKFAPMSRIISGTMAMIGVTCNAMRCGHSDRSIHFACAINIPSSTPRTADIANPVNAVRVLIARAVNIRSRTVPEKSSNKRCGGGTIIGLPEAGEKLLSSEYATAYHAERNATNTAVGPMMATSDFLTVWESITGVHP